MPCGLFGIVGAHRSAPSTRTPVQRTGSSVMPSRGRPTALSPIISDSEIDNALGDSRDYAFCVTLAML